MSSRTDLCVLDYCPNCGTSDPDAFCLDERTLQVTHCSHCRGLRAQPLQLLRHADAVRAFERVYFFTLLTLCPNVAQAARLAGVSEQGLRSAVRRVFPRQLRAAPMEDHLDLAADR